MFGVVQVMAVSLNSEMKSLLMRQTLCAADIMYSLLTEPCTAGLFLSSATDSGHVLAYFLQREAAVVTLLLDMSYEEGLPSFEATTSTR